MRLIWKYMRNYFLVYQLISKAKILDLQPEKYGLSFDIKKCTTSGWALGDENVIGKGPLTSKTEKLISLSKLRYCNKHIIICDNKTK